MTDDKHKRPGLLDDARGGLVGTGAPTTTANDGGNGPDTVRDGSAGTQPSQPPAVAAFRQLLLDPSAIQTTNLIMASGRHRRTLELFDLASYRVELRQGTLDPQTIRDALNAGLDLLAQLQQANKPHLKHDQLKRNVGAFASWLDEMRKLRDRLKSDLKGGAEEFRTFITTEERRGDEHEASDAIRTMAKVGVITGEVWQNLATSFDGRVSRDRLLDLARAVPKLGTSWLPPANRAEVEALLKCVAWIVDDESFRTFSAEPPPVTERELLQGSVKDVNERAAHLIARFRAAESAAPDLAKACSDPKMATWLATMDGVAKASSADASTRVAKLVWTERAHRFRRDMIAHVRKKHDDDRQIEYGEWVSLRDRAEEVIEGDKAGAIEALVMLCREVTKDLNWEPPIDPKILVDAERKKREEAEKIAHAQRSAAIDETKRQYEKQLAEKEREHARQREEQAKHFEQKVEAQKREHHREQVTDEATHAIEAMTGVADAKEKRPSLFLGPGIGAAIGIAVMFGIGAFLGHPFSPESRLSLAAAREPLTAEPPAKVGLVCAKKPDREKRQRENTQAIAQAASSIQPPTAASSVTRAAAAASCGVVAR